VRIHFASDDIPVPPATHANFTSHANSDFVHLPVVAGVVSFFHSDTPDLNLTACVLAQICTLTIVSWGDKQIVKLNPNLSPSVVSLPITAACRRDGSSSTDSSTKVCFVDVDPWLSDTADPTFLIISFVSFLFSTCTVLVLIPT
jgi:ABC-type phosphate transport system substrate-binding protein